MNFYQKIAELQAGGETVALCTVARTSGSVPRRAGSKMLVYSDGRIEGSVGGGEMEARVVAAALDAMQDGQPRVLSYTLNDPEQGDPGVCGGTVEVFVEAIRPEETVLVIGAGHVGKAVAELAHWLGFRVLVSDDRADLCTPEQVPDADGYYPMAMAELPKQTSITAQTYIVMTTRSLDLDVAGLPALLETPAAYIGVIGSKRRWTTARKALEEAGVSKKQLARVTSPMGLELKAETPEEIALSILGEIVKLRREGDKKAERD